MKKKLSYLLLVAIVVNSCVSQSEYDKLKSERNSVVAEMDGVKRELEDLKFGAPNLLAEGKVLYERKDYLAAKEKFTILVQKHPGKQESIEAYSFLETIDEEMLWQNALNSEDAGLSEQYITKYPRGKYTSAAKARSQELKELQQQNAYNNALSENTASAWKNFMADYPFHPEIASIKDKIIRLEVDELFSASGTGRMPSFERSSYSGAESSSVTIKNDTGCELVVRYSGPDAEMITIPEGGSRSVYLSSGSYRIVASACGYNYAGSESLSGAYNSTFYITSSR